MVVDVVAPRTAAAHFYAGVPLLSMMVMMFVGVVGSSRNFGGQDTNNRSDRSNRDFFVVVELNLSCDAAGIRPAPKITADCCWSSAVCPMAVKVDRVGRRLLRLLLLSSSSSLLFCNIAALERQRYEHPLDATTPAGDASTIFRQVLWKSLKRGLNPVPELNDVKNTFHGSQMSVHYRSGMYLNGQFDSMRTLKSHDPKKIHRDVKTPRTSASLAGRNGLRITTPNKQSQKQPTQSTMVAAAISRSETGKC
jgi:hypothetical protein